MRRPVGLKFGARGKKGFNRLDVGGAGSPMERCLTVRTGEATVDRRAGRDQECDRFSDSRMVAGPVGYEMKDRGGLSLVAESLDGEPLVVGEQCG